MSLQDRSPCPERPQANSLLIFTLDRANPDVAVFGWIAVVLQLDRAGWLVRRVFGLDFVAGRTEVSSVIMDENAIMKGRDISRRLNLPILEPWRSEDDVIHLPFAGRTRSID